MKNSTLIFRSILTTGVILFAWNCPVCFLTITIIAACLGLFFYILFCLFELNMHRDNYGNEKYDYVIVPRKYNFITVFIDWVDSFPSIIKKKDLEK